MTLSVPALLVRAALFLMPAALEDPVEPDIPEHPARQEHTMVPTRMVAQAQTAVLMDPIMGLETTAAPATDLATTAGIIHTEILLPAMVVPSQGTLRALTPGTWGVE